MKISRQSCRRGSKSHGNSGKIPVPTLPYMLVFPSTPIPSLFTELYNTSDYQPTPYRPTLRYLVSSQQLHASTTLCVASTTSDKMIHPSISRHWQELIATYIEFERTAATVDIFMFMWRAKGVIAAINWDLNQHDDWLLTESRLQDLRLYTKLKREIELMVAAITQHMDPETLTRLAAIDPATFAVLNSGPRNMGTSSAPSRLAMRFWRCIYSVKERISKPSLPI
ncbi:hypothetical protein F4802DRAFT_549522 [Xylaria palmicola]|nr:hypothetical protein F4802DRAFT_549522 [Xylaria palmicola]